jgi:hypothetical protein
VTCQTINVSGSAVVVCAPPRGVVRRAVFACRNCRRRTRHVVRFGGIWYGSTDTCCACGDSWTGGERHERPFVRAWRAKATAKARADWRTALTAQEYDDWIAAELRATLAGGSRG